VCVGRVSADKGGNGRVCVGSDSADKVKKTKSVATVQATAECG
jgi:hypothetical protein